MNETEHRALTLVIAAARQSSRFAQGYGLVRAIVAGAVPRSAHILSWRCLEAFLRRGVHNSIQSKSAYACEYCCATKQQICEAYVHVRVIVAGAVSRSVRILSHGSNWRFLSEDVCTIAWS